MELFRILIGWVSGFARVIGYTTSVAAELWALWDGINLCVDLNLTNVIIELDAKLVVELLQNEDGRNNGNEVIITDCREGLKKILTMRIQHCFREANMCADALARRCAFLSQEFVIFQSPLSDVSLLISLDASGTVYERKCSAFMFLSE